MRPNVERFVVHGKHGIEGVLELPIRSVMAHDEAVVTEILGQRGVLHQLVLHIAPQLHRLLPVAHTQLNTREARRSLHLLLFLYAASTTDSHLIILKCSHSCHYLATIFLTQKMTPKLCIKISLSISKQISACPRSVYISHCLSPPNETSRGKKKSNQ